WSAATHFLAGQTARRASMYPQAEAQYERFLQLRGRDPGAVASVALERLLIPAQQGELIQVEELLWEKVKKEAPEAPLVLEAMARGYMRMLRLTAALRCVNLILEQDPDNVEALANRGWIKERAIDEMEAIKDYRRVLELRPDRDDVRSSLAHILVKDN